MNDKRELANMIVFSFTSTMKRTAAAVSASTSRQVVYELRRGPRPGEQARRGSAGWVEPCRGAYAFACCIGYTVTVTLKLHIYIYIHICIHT